jgi:hypothetical protein
MTNEVRYPPSWSGLSFPAKRFELLGYIEEIVETGSMSGRQQTEFDIDQIFHFFFDDTNLADEDESSIGTILIDSGEELAVRKLTQRLDRLFNKIGDASTREYLAHPDWGDLAREAHSVAMLLNRSGKPEVG